MTKRIFALVLALLLALSLLPVSVLAAEDPDVIYINSNEDFLDFSKNCTLDTWSQGKTFLLAADLDFTGVEVPPVPTFGGAFDGAGHRITGLSITRAGSNQGLFRYIQKDGVVENLVVDGQVAPAGSAVNVGFIAGSSAGTIRSCGFNGGVKGRSNVGGIVGFNQSTGLVFFSGGSDLNTITGDSCVGGIAGRNAGTILQCDSRGQVNTTAAEAATTLDELEGIDPSAPLDQLTEPSSTQSGDSAPLSDRMDIGGVAGYSSGVIQSCTNFCPVGYPHVGYNVGGIAGRNTGYVADCQNNGSIQGRKDVGGVVGQAEPYVVMAPDSDTLTRLRAALSKLSGLIDKAAGDAASAGDDISAQFTALGGSADLAKDDSKALLDKTGDLLNANVDSLNTLSAALTAALDHLSPAMGDLGDTADRFADLADDLGPALDALSRAGDAAGAAMDRLGGALSALKAASGDLQTAARNLQAALGGLRPYLADLNDALKSGGAGQIEEALKALLEKGLPAALPALETALADFDRAAAQLKTAFALLEDAAASGGRLSGELSDAFQKLKAAANGAQSAARSLSAAFGKLKGAAEELRRAEDFTLTPVDEAYRAAGDRLFTSLSAVSAGMEDLNASAATASRTLSADLRAVNGQFSVVSNLMLDALEDLQSGAADDGPDDHIRDVSEEDVAATTLGKIANCTSECVVEGDRNVGGIAGSLAIEYDLDPEDDSSLDLSFNAVYETKAVLIGCVSCSAVTGKKDCVGGVVGRMDLGLVSGCENYGAVKSTDGGYVGGVAGLSVSTIQSSYAKCALSGGDFIGGVAGSAQRLRGCAAIVHIDSAGETLGAIAGDMARDGSLQSNFYLDDGLGAVDGVSYAGRAQAADFEALRALPGVPAAFVSFTLTLRAGDPADGDAEPQTVARIPFYYGEDLSLIDLGAVPEREGYFGRWPDFDPAGVHSDLVLDAVYAPWITVLTAVPLQDGLPLALAEGKFTDTAVLHIQSVPLHSPPSPPDGVDGLMWDISLTGSGLTADDPLPLRILCPGGGTVWQYSNGGEWMELSSRQNGSYLQTRMSGTAGILCVVPDGGLSLSPAAAWAAGGGGLLVLAAVLVLRRKKKKRASAASAAASQPSPGPAAAGPSENKNPEKRSEPKK